MDLDDKKIVTGLDITSGVPRVLRKFRRDLQRDVFFVWSDGLASHVSRQKIFNPNYLNQLEGRLEFWKHVEPGNKQMIRCQNRLQHIKRNLSYLNRK